MTTSRKPVSASFYLSCNVICLYELFIKQIVKLASYLSFETFFRFLAKEAMLVSKYSQIEVNLLIFCVPQEVKRFPTLQAEITAAATEALEKFRDESRKTALRMVEMESSYLTVDFFRKLPQELDKGGNPSSTANDRYTEGHLKRIGKKKFPLLCIKSLS